MIWANLEHYPTDPLLIVRGFLYSRTTKKLTLLLCWFHILEPLAYIIDPWSTHTIIRGLMPVIYLTNIISPLYVYCHQHQNMIKGMIALSVLHWGALVVSALQIRWVCLACTLHTRRKISEFSWRSSTRAISYAMGWVVDTRTVLEGSVRVHLVHHRR